MALGKQILVLSGGGHKGVVKLLCGGGMLKGSCALDFRPVGASLYFAGENIVKVGINDINTTFEVPFVTNSDISCVLRSSSVTMFGGVGNKADLLKKIDDFAKGADRAKPANPSKISSDDHAKAVQDKVAADASPDGANAVGAGDMAQAMGAARGEARSVRMADALGEDWIKYDGNNFYYAVKPQIDEMFVCYPLEESLGKAVENSKWVKIEAEDGYYVVGLLFDDAEPAFICYGVPSVSADSRPPKELEDMCVWLPLTQKTADAAGYWVIYQSAKTGEIVK